MASTYMAPRYNGYIFSKGGYAYYLAGEDGKEYLSKSHRRANFDHKLKRKEPRQNLIDNEDDSIKPESGGTVTGIVMNDIKLDRDKVPGQLLDRSGPATDAIAMHKRQKDTAGETASKLQYERYGAQKL